MVRKLTDGVKQGRLGPGGSSFKREAGKLDNWLNHKRIEDYFRPQTQEEVPDGG